MADIHIHLQFSRELAHRALMGLLVLSCAPELGSETVTLTTYYPAPSGVYANMITTGNTWLARDSAVNSGYVNIGSAAAPGNASTRLIVMNGRVGIGNANPSAMLDVNGDAKVSSNLAVSGMINLGSRAVEPPGTNGDVYYNSTSQRFRGYKGGGWADLGLNGYQIVRVGNGENFSSAMAFCPAPKKIIGGGCGNYGSDQTTGKKLVWSMPLSGDNGWVCYWDMPQIAGAVSAMAICANVSP